MTREQAIIRLRRISTSLNKYCDVNDCIRGDCAKCYDALDMAEKALQQEPKRGKWIDKGDFYVCSECGNRMAYAVLDSELSQAYAFMSDYCPHCGARMESDER